MKKYFWLYSPLAVSDSSELQIHANTPKTFEPVEGDYGAPSQALHQISYHLEAAHAQGVLDIFQQTGKRFLATWCGTCSGVLDR